VAAKLKKQQRRAIDLDGAPGGLLSIDRAARYLAVASVTVRQWMRDGKLPYVRLGRRMLIRPERLEEFIRAHERTGDE
jgi:excisionase family DNA binding protein